MERIKDNEGTPFMTFAAISPSVERTILSARESKVTGREWVQWGDRNEYPNYLQKLFEGTNTLHAVVLGLVDYIIGNGVEVDRQPWNGKAINGKGMTPRELAKETAKSIGVYGGFAWQLVPSKAGELLEIYPLKMQYVRMNAEANTVFYCENWARRCDTATVYGRWSGAFARDAKTGKYRSSVLVVKCWGDGVYPSPLHAAALKACETERAIDEFHLGNIERGFMGSYIINFNGGKPQTDEIRREIERDVNRKFAGSRNAGRILLAFNNDKDHAVTLQKLDVADYGEKYDTLAKHSRQQIFTAFRANPNLFGIPTENLGFSSEEYESAFKLFNRTIVTPLQDTIVEAWGAATGGNMTIAPFTLEGADTDASTGIGTGGNTIASEG